MADEQENWLKPIKQTKVASPKPSRFWDKLGHSGGTSVQEICRRHSPAVGFIHHHELNRVIVIWLVVSTPLNSMLVNQPTNQPSPNMEENKQIKPPTSGC